MLYLTLINLGGAMNDNEAEIRRAIQLKIPALKCSSCNSTQHLILDNDGNPETVTLACAVCGHCNSYVINILKKGI